MNSKRPMSAPKFYRRKYGGTSRQVPMPNAEGFVGGERGWIMGVYDTGEEFFTWDEYLASTKKETQKETTSTPKVSTKKATIVKKAS